MKSMLITIVLAGVVAGILSACGTSPAWRTVTAEVTRNATATLEAATVEAIRAAIRATSETREASRAVTAEARATNEANPTYQARKTTATAETRRTVEASRTVQAKREEQKEQSKESNNAMGTDVPQWLITDVENITRRMKAINPHLSSCPLSSSERSSYMKRLEKYQYDSLAVAKDANDGSIDDYSMLDLVSITNDGFEIVGELELKCR